MARPPSLRGGDCVSKAKEKGTRMETGVVGFLCEWFEDDEGTIGRSSLKGSKDEGDIHGLKANGGKVVVEVKNCRKYDADYGIVVFHVNGIGLENMGKQGVLMSLETFCKLIGGTE